MGLWALWCSPFSVQLPKVEPPCNTRARGLRTVLPGHLWCGCWGHLSMFSVLEITTCLSRIALVTVLSLTVLFIIHINRHSALSCCPFSKQLLVLSCWTSRSIKSFHTVLRRYIIYFSLRKCQVHYTTNAYFTKVDRHYCFACMVYGGSGGLARQLLWHLCNTSLSHISVTPSPN